HATGGQCLAETLGPTGFVDAVEIEQQRHRQPLSKTGRPRPRGAAGFVQPGGKVPATLPTVLAYPEAAQSDWRKTISAARSSISARPGKLILVPGAKSAGFSRKAERLSGVQIWPSAPISASALE